MGSQCADILYSRIECCDARSDTEHTLCPPATPHQPLYDTHPTPTTATTAASNPASAAATRSTPTNTLLRTSKHHLPERVMARPLRRKDRINGGVSKERPGSRGRDGSASRSRSRGGERTPASYDTDHLQLQQHQHQHQHQQQQQHMQQDDDELMNEDVDMERERRNTTHQFHNNINAYLDRENSLSGPPGAPASSSPLSSSNGYSGGGTYNPYSTNSTGRNNSLTGGANWLSTIVGVNPSANGKGKRKLSDYSQPLTNGYDPQSMGGQEDIYGGRQGVKQEFYSSGAGGVGGGGDGLDMGSAAAPFGGAAFQSQQQQQQQGQPRRPSLSTLGGYANNGVASTPTLSSAHPQQSANGAQRLYTPAPSQQQQPTRSVTDAFASYSASHLSGTFPSSLLPSGNRQRSLTGPPPSIAARRMVAPALGSSAINAISSLLPPPPPPPASSSAFAKPKSAHGHHPHHPHHAHGHLAPPHSPALQYPCACLATATNTEHGEGDTTAFVRTLIANVRQVVGFLETVHPPSASYISTVNPDGAGLDSEEARREYEAGVKAVGECAVVRCLNQLDRAIRYVLSLIFHWLVHNFLFLYFVLLIGSFPFCRFVGLRITRLADKKHLLPCLLSVSPLLPPLKRLPLPSAPHPLALNPAPLPPHLSTSKPRNTITAMVINSNSKCSVSPPSLSLLPSLLRLI